MSNPSWQVTFTVSSEQAWISQAGGLTALGTTGIVVPTGASITEVFQPGYFYQPPANLGDPVTATWETSDPGSGWIRVTDPQTTS